MRRNTRKAIGLTASCGLILVVGYLGLEAVKQSNVEFLGVQWGAKPEPYIGVRVGFKEGSTLTRQVLVSPQGWYAVDLCRTQVVPGHKNRGSAFTGYKDWTNITRAFQGGNSCR